MSERRLKEKIVYTYKSPSLIKAEDAIDPITRPIDARRRLRAARRRQWALGNTRPMPWLDGCRQGGNANPKWKRNRGHGHYNCGSYRP